jgi:hypothetical protein
MKPPRRTMTTLAVGVLALDAVLLALAAAWFSRPWLVLPAVLCAFGALGTLVLWRRYQRHVRELAELVETRRREARREAEAIRDLLHSHNFHN